jgi:hypothetical protein
MLLLTGVSIGLALSVLNVNNFHATKTFKSSVKKSIEYEVLKVVQKNK